MKTEGNFYDIIGSKFNNQQIPFDEQDWNSMRKMIDDSRTDKRRTMWLLVALCLLLFSGATFGIYEWSNNGVAAQHNNAVVANIKNSNNSQVSTVANKQMVNSVSSNAPANNKTARESDNTPMAPNSGTSQQNQSNRNAVAAIVTNENSNKINDKKYIVKSLNKKNALTNNGSQPVASIAENANSGKNSVTGANEQNNLSSGKLSTDPATTGNATMPSNSISVKTTGSITNIKSVHNMDSAVAADALPQRFSDEPRIFQGKINIFSVEAGGEYSFGWAVNSDGTLAQGKGLNYNLGLGYEHYMGSKIFLKTGIQFSTFGNMHTGTYNYQHSVGNVIYDSVITTKRLYFLKVPIQVEYFIGRNKRSSVGCGGSVWFLVGNRGYATTYQQGENTPPMNMVQYSQNASFDGYTKIDFSADAFYRYIISHKFSMYLSFYTEFTNMRENSVFGGNITDNTRGFQYTLSYDLN
jgi:hypothetical protein